MDNLSHQYLTCQEVSCLLFCSIAVIFLATALAISKTNIGVETNKAKLLAFLGVYVQESTCDSDISLESSRRNFSGGAADVTTAESFDIFVCVVALSLCSIVGCAILLVRERATSAD